MATVATLAVNVIAQTGGFNKGLDKAGAKAKGFGKSVGGASGGMSKMIPIAAAATAAIAAVAIVAMKVGEAFDRMDAAAKKARSMGMAAQDLMAFQHAAKLGGVGADQMATALQKMQKGIGEGLAGTGLAKDAFERMGISMEEIGAIPAKEQMFEIADAIAAIDNPAERAAAATAIFGRAGADLLPVLAGGSAALKAQEKDLISLQGTLSAADFAKIEDSNDAWTRFGTAMEGIWNQLAVAVAPLMEFIGNGLANIAGWIARIIDAWNSLVGIETEVVAPVENVEAHLAAMEKEAAAADAALKAREALEQKGASLMESMRTPMEQYNDTVANLNSMLDAGVISWDTYGRAVEKAQKDVKKSSEFAAKEIKLTSEKSVGAAVRGKTGTYSIQLKQQQELKKIREQEKQQLAQLKQQTSLLEELNSNIKTGTVVTI